MRSDIYQTLLHGTLQRKMVWPFVHQLWCILYLRFTTLQWCYFSFCTTVSGSVHIQVHLDQTKGSYMFINTSGLIYLAM